MLYRKPFIPQRCFPRVLNLLRRPKSTSRPIPSNNLLNNRK